MKFKPEDLPEEAIPAICLEDFSGYIWWLPESATSTDENEWCIRPYHPLMPNRPRCGWAIKVQFPGKKGKYRG